MIYEREVREKNEELLTLRSKSKGASIMEVGRAVRILRKSRGQKQSDLARAAGISVPMVSLLESGERQPSLSVLRRLAKALGIASEALILMALSKEESLHSHDPATREMADSVRRLAEAEERLSETLRTGISHGTNGSEG
jgi:transcriptional regulator with XRE-family HTH domain